ncbi:MAG: endonuclease/exonuclease/phosphatase family protein [Acidimicrobiia bacterium]
MTFTLTSFNAHAGVRPRTDGSCMPYDLAGVIEQIAGDVTVVQETWWPEGQPSVVAEAAERIGAALFELPFGRAAISPWPQVRRDGCGTGLVGVSVLSRLPATQLRTIPFGRVFNDHTPERAGIHLEVLTPDGPIDLIGLHLTSRLPYGPPIHLRRLRAQLPPPTRPAVVAGDCNFWGPGVVTFLPGWRRAVRGRSWPARAPHSQIDHILLRDGTTSSWRVLDSAVLPDVGSDHRPVRATLELQ